MGGQSAAPLESLSTLGTLEEALLPGVSVGFWRGAEWASRSNLWTELRGGQGRWGAAGETSNLHQCLKNDVDDLLDLDIAIRSKMMSYNLYRKLQTLHEGPTRIFWVMALAIRIMEVKPCICTGFRVILTQITDLGLDIVVVVAGS